MELVLPGGIPTPSCSTVLSLSKRDDDDRAHIYLTIHGKRARFLLNLGGNANLVPLSMTPDGGNRKKTSFVKVSAGSKVPTYAEVSLDVKFDDSKSQNSNFICTAVNQSIL
ncbi:unnamed protein product [Lepeophtheirus salmonis]|uniref:(salmon louse) hypothetical protein n=1 Tax=Lepeophtheirus salmonis TaxID=72036 RepID=A0A7R8GZ82_LEPSM|nr:unnamed protein product [Lepeophtheirus salmonis]CAF2759452.1 unnamed protein product [Lepeophtheirus salmonis]